MVNILMCYSNPTIVNMYWHYRKLVYKIIVNRGGYGITYFVAGYWIYSTHMYCSVADRRISYFVITLSYDNYYVNLRDYSNSIYVNMYWYYRKLIYKIIVNRGGYRIIYFVAGYWIYSPYIYIYILLLDVHLKIAAHHLFWNPL